MDNENSQQQHHQHDSPPENPSEKYHEVLPDFHVENLVKNKQEAAQKAFVKERKEEKVRIKTKNKMALRLSFHSLYSFITRIIFFRIIPLFSILFIITTIIGYSITSSDSLEKADVVIVLNSEESQVITKGIQLIKEKNASHILILGERRINAVSSFTSQAIAAGIPSDSIISEQTGLTIYDQASVAERILDEKGFNKIIIIAPEYQQRRVALSFIGAFRILGGEVSIINTPLTLP